MMNLLSVCDLSQLEAVIAESCERPVLLFKHSRTCGISHEALGAVHEHVARHRGRAAYRLITVQSHRHVSDEAASRLGVRHQTPQAILLRDGRPVWNASHFSITADRLDQVLS